MNINLSDQVSRGRTGPDGQTIPGHRWEERFCKRQYLYVLKQKIKITLTVIKTLGYLST